VDAFVLSGEMPITFGDDAADFGGSVELPLALAALGGEVRIKYS